MPSLAELKSAALGLATNLRGWKTRRKLLVIESDDWGAIRMPGPEAYQRLLGSGIGVDRSPFDSLDCLESRDDLEALMNVADAHRDSRGRPITLTFNTVMGNPDFDAIERDRFEKFHHQHFFDSYRHYHGEDMESTWRRAISEHRVKPQLHGGEHLNVPLWMRDLRAGHAETRLAFSLRFYGLTTQTCSPRQVNYLAAFWAETLSDLDLVRSRLKEGLRLFSETFGYDSVTFIACNYIFPEQLEPLLLHKGVGLLQGQRGEFVPRVCGSGGRARHAFTGKLSKGGLLRSVRNVKFEPFLDKDSDWVDSALSEISQSFALRRPAIISSHRANYVGGMSKQTRDDNLKQFDRLIRTVFKKWPDAEILSSDELFRVISQKIESSAI